VSEQRDRMLRGEPYLADAPDIRAESRRCALLLERFNGTSVTQLGERRAILAELLGELGEDVVIRPPLMMDLGYQTSIGSRTFINANAVILDVGFKSEGSVPLDEFKDPQALKEGDEVEVFLEHLEDQEGAVVLSKKKADFMRVWEKIRVAHEALEVVEVLVGRLDTPDARRLGRVAVLEIVDIRVAGHLGRVRDDTVDLGAKLCHLIRRQHVGHHQVAVLGVEIDLGRRQHERLRG